MRIAVVCPDLGIRVPGRKGASVHLQAISSAFAAIGHSVLLLAVAGHGRPPGSISSLLLPHPGRSSGLRREVRKLRFSARFASRVEAVLDDFAPDMVYERLSLFGSVGRALADRHAVPHVLEVNALLAREDAAWRGLRLVALARRRERLALQRADLRIAVSEEVADAIDDVAPGAPLEVVPNGVDTAAFASLPSRDEARAAFELASDRRWLGFVGALRPWHGVEHAIDALERLPGDICLAVAGDGPVRPTLEAHARGIGVAERIRWLGHVPHWSIPAFLAAVDIAIAPYPPRPDFAFSPLKVYEYLAAGRPTIGSDLGQLGCLLRELPGGIPVPAGDTAAIVAAVEGVLSAPEDWSRRAAAARSMIFGSHSWEQRAEQICVATERIGRRALAA